MARSLNSQRKSPKQGRSKALVDAIFEATVRILPSLGSRQITTRKIADLAGVSVGSLYQYFPNKEAVLSAVMDMAMRSTADEVTKKIDAIHVQTFEEFISAIVDFVLELFLAEKQRTREIFMMAPELGKMPNLLKLRQTVVERLAAEMKSHTPKCTEEECLRISFIAVNSFMGVIQTVLYDESIRYSMAELSSELKIMLHSYFRDRKQGGRDWTR